MSDNGAKGPKHVLLRSKGQRTGGKASPWRAPYGVACGQALQPCGLNGGLTTGSRPRRASTPFLIENFPIPHSPFPSTEKQATIRALSRAHSPGCRSTYHSGNTVQANRATSLTSGLQVRTARCARLAEASALACGNQPGQGARELGADRYLFETREGDRHERITD